MARWRAARGLSSSAGRCLLKGCERPFWPRRPQARYCSEGCQQAARRWWRRQASRRYRATDQGLERRRDQAPRYRQRRRERRTASADAKSLREGQRPASRSEDSSTRRCERPGCYEHFSIKHEQSCRCFLQRGVPLGFASRAGSGVALPRTASASACGAGDEASAAAGHLLSMSLQIHFHVWAA